MQRLNANQTKTNLTPAKVWKDPNKLQNNLKIGYARLQYGSAAIFLTCILSCIIEIERNCDEKNYGLGTHCIAVNAVDYQ